MKGISRSPVRRNDGFHRYMKPGALAQIRNARINNARSNFPLTRSLSDPVDPPSSSSESPIAATPQTITMDQMPHLLSKIYGPYRIGRKKLGPARSAMVKLNPSPNSILESINGNSNVLNNNDVLVAHWMKLKVKFPFFCRLLCNWYSLGKYLHYSSDFYKYQNLIHVSSPSISRLISLC